MMATIRHSTLSALLFAAVLVAGAANGASRWARETGGLFTPVTPENQAEFYTRSNRSATVRVDLDRTLRPIAPGFLGINLSSFSDTTDVWREYKIPETLRYAGVGALRFPGGAETGFYHWRSPGVNGYEDLWEPEAQRGKSDPKVGRFQAVWVAPENWATNRLFMSVDEYLVQCRSLGAEPIVGLNLSSGVKYGRRAEGIQEALDLMRHCRDAGYKVTYWYLDNEPWNEGNANYTFKGNTYAEEVLVYGTAIKREFPDARLIGNPTQQDAGSDTIRAFLQTAGKVVDYLDVHWYWDWGRTSFDLWLDQPPSYGGTISRIRRTNSRIRTVCREAGYPGIGLVVLEWNVAPSDWSVSFSPALSAVIQGNLLLDFLNNNVELTCLWPLLWRTSREVWPEQDVFQSIVSSLPPYERTLSAEMFRMFSAVRGRNSVACESDASRNVVCAAVNDPARNTATVLLVSRSPLRRRITFDFGPEHSGPARLEAIPIKDNKLRTEDALAVRDGKVVCFIEPYSFNALTVRFAKKGGK
jgi:alpha-L-arabinofuranosidase